MAQRGAPVGNQNAVKHGFYSKVVTDTEVVEMEEAKGIEGLDEELALLRVKLRRILENNPDRIDLHLQAVGMIVRVVRARYVLTPQGKEKLKAAVGKVLTEVAIPLGLKQLP